MKQIQNFTEGKIFAPLVRFALPVLLALFLQAMYGAVDLLVVGQFGGELADVYVSGVSTGSQLMHTVTTGITGLAMGLTVFVGRKIGAGQKEEAGKIIGSGIWLFGLIAAALTVLLVCTATPLARLMRAPKEALDHTVLYITICSAGSVFIVAYNLLGSIFRGIGDSKTPLMTVAIACVLNILGDLLLVAVFHMGAAGAAIATVFAQAVSVLVSLIIIKKRSLPFAFSIKDIRAKAAYIKETLKLGTPIAFQDVLVGVSFLAVLAIVNNLGLTASAGCGVANKVCAFLMLIPAAYMQAMSAFVAQNMGAAKPERAKKALWCGIVSSLAVGVVVAFVTFFHGDLLSGIFAKDADVILASADYLKAYAIDCILTSFLFCFIGYFNGLGSTTFVMIQGITGAIGIRLPVSWLMSKVLPASLFRIGLATPASTIVQILLCSVYFAIALRRQKNRRLN